jgi:hypothetical protein
MNSGTIFIAIFVMVFLGILGFALYSRKQRKDASWSGTVTDKNAQEVVQNSNIPYQNQNRSFGVTLGGVNNVMGNNQVVTHQYDITVMTDEGKELRWPVSSGMYETVSIGDKLVKRSGTETSEITAKAPQSVPQGQQSPTSSAQVSPPPTTPTQMPPQV